MGRSMWATMTMAAPMTIRWYILDGHEPKATASFDEYVAWSAQHHPVRVGDDHFGHAAIGVVHVSTVFLGLDHRHFGDGPPILFESMIFGGDHDQEQRRCCTWDEAEKMHAEMVALAVSQFKELQRDIPGA